jgi:hypothetical protein
MNWRYFWILKLRDGIVCWDCGTPVVYPPDLNGDFVPGCECSHEEQQPAALS